MDNKPAGNMGAIALGLIVGAFGVVILLIAAQVIPYPPEKIHAPMWVIGAAGVVFLLGGGMAFLQGVVSIVGQSLGTGDSTEGLKALNALLASMLMTVFATIPSWIAFGGGERHFTQRTMILGAMQTRAMSDFNGRWVFGIAAILMWGIALMAWKQLLKLLVGRFRSR